MSLYSSDRPDFMERIGKLAGGTAYRVPTEGRGTRTEQLPDAHAIATALAFAKQGPDDIGPDVAYCWVLQSDAYRQKVVRQLSAAMRCREFQNHGQHRLAAADMAWEVMIHNRKPSTPAPADCSPAMWDRMLLVALGVLHSKAWDAVAEAERRYHKAA